MRHTGRRAFGAAAGFVLVLATSGRAQSLTYDFVEISGGAGGIGATWTFASPPAMPNTGWISFANSATMRDPNVLDFHLIDPTLGIPVGPYNFDNDSITDEIQSFTGAMLDRGIFDATNASLQTLETILPSPGGTPATATLAVFGDANSPVIDGLWELAPAPTPEPSSWVLVVAGLVTAFGGSWCRRRNAARSRDRTASHA